MNALKYRCSERESVITITHTLEEGGSRLTVADNGVGIPPTERERAFGMFQRLHHTSGAEGIGFGLSYCRRIVELHEGSIELTSSRLGVGTEVRMHFPHVALEPAVAV